MSGDDKSEFGDLLNAYNAEPTIENYVHIRRKYPSKSVEIVISEAVDWLLANESTLRKFSLDPNLVGSTLDGDGDAINSLSIHLLELLIDRRAIIASGKTHAISGGDAIGDSLINYLIAMMLDTLDWPDSPRIPRDLIVLIRHQLGADVSAEVEKQKVQESMGNAAYFAARLRERGHRGSIRQVAKYLGVSPSTVSRWFKSTNFEDEVQERVVWLQSDDANRMRKMATDARKRRRTSSE